MSQILIISIALTTPILVILFATCSYYFDYFASIFSEDEATPVYDFIVVGAGSAGAVVAARLAKHSSVLLLEAGGNPSKLNQIPGMVVDVVGFSQTDWLQETVPQKDSCRGLKGEASQWTKGKMLGGTSGLNWMMYNRGHPLDYELWANITGDQSWNYENLLPHFRKSIKRYGGKYPENKKHNGESDYGFLHIEKRSWEPMSQHFYDAGKEFGLNEMDANGPQKSGFGPIHVNQNKGERWGTYAALLRDNNNPNLVISRYSHVTKVKLDKSGRAVGVFYYRHGKKKFARASKEVIVSAGTTDSAKLLMLSGIGPKTHLASVGIKSLIDLPVGQNLQDHVFTFVMPFLINDTLTFLADRDFGLGAFTQYYKDGSGPMSTPNAVYGQGFFGTSSVKKRGKDWPNIQFFFSPAGTFSLLSAMFENWLNIKPEVIKPLLDPYIGRDSFSVVPVLVRPQSVGQITLRNKDPFENPLIDPRYYENPNDVKAMVEGINLLLDIFEKSKAFKSVDSQLGNNPLVGCESHKFRSDAYWECYIKSLTFTLWHPIGTCRMGKESDKKTVVDTQLRVLKTINLRVVDASIMPVIINANTNAPAFLIGEKGADSIREYWSKQFLVCHKYENMFKVFQNQCHYSRFM